MIFGGVLGFSCDYLHLNYQKIKARNRGCDQFAIGGQQKQEQKVESKLTEKQKKDIDDETSNDESKLVEDDKAENNKPESSTESDLKSQEEE